MGKACTRLVAGDTCRLRTEGDSNKHIADVVLHCAVSWNRRGRGHVVGCCQITCWCNGVSASDIAGGHFTYDTASQLTFGMHYTVPGMDSPQYRYTHVYIISHSCTTQPHNRHSACITQSQPWTVLSTGTHAYTVQYLPLMYDTASQQTFGM